MISSIVAPTSRFSKTVATGIRVSLNTHAPLRLPGTLSTAGHCDQSRLAIFASLSRFQGTENLPNGNDTITLSDFAASFRLCRYIFPRCEPDGQVGPSGGGMAPAERRLWRCHALTRPAGRRSSTVSGKFTRYSPV